MSLNDPPPRLIPSALCVAYAPSLALLSTGELDPEQERSLREHLADCRWCRAKLAGFDVVDAALRRHWGVGSVASRAATVAEIADARERGVSPNDWDVPEEPEISYQFTRTPRHWTHLATLAAVLLVALLAASLANQRDRTGPASSSRHHYRFAEFGIPASGADPYMIARGPDGNLWFTEQRGGRIGRITPSGVIAEFPVPTRGAELGGIASGPDGNLWFSEGAKIGRITPEGGVTEYAIPPTPGGPHIGDITAGPDGALWFTESGGDAIGRITVGGAITLFPATHPGFGLAFGPDGSLWFPELVAGDAGGSSAGYIARRLPGGATTRFVLTDEASTAYAITVGPDGNLWLVMAPGTFSSVVRVTPGDGETIGFPINTAHGLNDGATVTLTVALTGIAAGPDGALWFTDRGLNQIGRSTTRGEIAEFPIPTRNAGPAAIVAGPDGTLWFTELRAGQIGRFSP